MRSRVKKELQGKALALIEANKNLKLFQKKYQSHSRLEYLLPKRLRELDWVIPLLSTIPYDSLRGATRALSNLDEALSINPVTVMKAIGSDDSLAAREMANQWERILQWELGRSSRRRRNLRSDAIWSAATYDEIVAQLIHLPTQFKIVEPSPSRKRAALMFGDWAIRIVDPQDVYVRYSEYMPEAVLYASVKTAQQIVDEATRWGGEGRALEVVEKRLQEARALAPQYGGVYRALGKLYYDHARGTPSHRQPYLQKAMTFLNKATALATDDFLAWFYLYLVYQALFQEQQAHHCLWKVVDASR